MFTFVYVYYPLSHALDLGNKWTLTSCLLFARPLEGTNEENIDVNGPATKESGTREESRTTKPQGNILADKECKDLIEGLYVKDIETLLTDAKTQWTDETFMSCTFSCLIG